MDLLVIFLLEKFIAKELHGTDNEKLSSSWTDIECTNRSVGWETDWTTGQKSYTWLSNINCRTIGIDKLESSILISLGQIVLSVSILSRVLSRLVPICFLFTTIGDSKKNE